MSLTPTYIVILRHGQRRDDAPDAADEEDPSLTELGKAQTADIAHILQARFGENALYEHAQLFVSPFTRTLETAVVLQENGIGLVQPFVVDNELCEVYGPIRIKSGKAPNLAIATYINTNNYSQHFNTRNTNKSKNSNNHSDLLSSHMDEMRQWNVLGNLPQWGETIESASERFVNRFNVIAHSLNKNNNNSNGSGNGSGWENSPYKYDYKTSDTDDFDDKEDDLLVSTPITERNGVASFYNSNNNDLSSSADQESPTHLPECVIRKDRTCDIDTKLKIEKIHREMQKPNNELNIYNKSNSVADGSGDGSTSNNNNNNANSNNSMLQIAILITHGDALGAILNHFYPSLIVYETKYLSYLILRSSATHNDNFTLEYASGVEWIDDGVSNISDVSTDKGITTESIIGQNANEEPTSSSSTLQHRHDNVTTQNTEERQRHHTQRVHGRTRESAKIARYKHNGELIKKHNTAHNVEHVKVAPTSRVRTRYSKMHDDKEYHDTMYKHHYPEHTHLSQLGRHYGGLHQNKQLHTNEESVQSVPFAVTPRLNKNVLARQIEQTTRQSQNINDHNNRKSSNFNEMKTLSPESLATTASQGETRTSFGQSMPRSPSATNDYNYNNTINDLNTTRVESKLSSSMTRTCESLPHAEMTSFHLHHHHHPSLVLQGTAHHELSEHHVQNGICVTYPLITAPVRTSNTVCTQANHKSTMKRKCKKIRSRALNTEHVIADTSNRNNNKNKNNSTLESTKARILSSSNNGITQNFIDCVETKHPMEANLITRVTMPKSDVAKYTCPEVTNGCEWSDIVHKDYEYSSPDYSKSMSNTESGSGIGVGSNSWRYYSNCNRSYTMNNGSNTNRCNVMNNVNAGSMSNSSNATSTTNTTSASSSFDRSVCRRCREKEMRFEERRWQALRSGDQANSTDYSAHSREWEGGDMQAAFDDNINNEAHNSNNNYSDIESKKNKYTISSCYSLSNTHQENNTALKNIDYHNNNNYYYNSTDYIQNKEESVDVEVADDDDVDRENHITIIDRNLVHESLRINQNEFYFHNLYSTVLHSFALRFFCFSILPFAHNNIDNLYSPNSLRFSCVLRVMTILFLLLLVISLFIVSADNLHKCTLIIFSITAIACELAQLWLLVYASSHPCWNCFRCCIEQLDPTLPAAVSTFVLNVASEEAEELVEYNFTSNVRSCSYNDWCEDNELLSVKHEKCSNNESASDCPERMTATYTNNNDDSWSSGMRNINYALKKSSMCTCQNEDNSLDEGNETEDSNAISYTEMPNEQRAANKHKWVCNDNNVNSIIDNTNRFDNHINQMHISNNNDVDDECVEKKPTEAKSTTTLIHSVSTLRPVFYHTPEPSDTLLELTNEACHVNQFSWLQSFTLYKLCSCLAVLSKQVVAFTLKFVFIMTFTDLFSFLCLFIESLCRTSTTSTQTQSFTLACLRMIEYDWHMVNYVLFALYALSNIVRGLIDKFNLVQRRE